MKCHTILCFEAHKENDMRRWRVWVKTFKTLETSDTSNSASSFIFPSESGLIESHLVSLWGNSSAAGLDMREQAKGSIHTDLKPGRKGLQDWDRVAEFFTASIHFSPLFTEENACGPKTRVYLVSVPQTLSHSLRGAQGVPHSCGQEVFRWRFYIL